jgi:hypothetical protein
MPWHSPHYSLVYRQTYTIIDAGTNPPHPVHYKIKSLYYAIIWVVVGEVGRSRDNNVTCSASLKYVRVCFKTESGIFTGMFGFKPNGTRIKIWTLMGFL